MANKLFSTGGSNDGESGFMIWSFRDFRQVARNDRESGLLTFLKFVFLVGCLFVNSSYVRKSFSPLGKEENTLRSGQVCFCVLFLLLTHGWGRTIHSLCFYVTVFEKSLNSFFFFWQTVSSPDGHHGFSHPTGSYYNTTLAPPCWEAGSMFRTLKFEQILHYGITLHDF